MKHILDNIKKNEFEHAYLIYGEEDYLKNFYKNKLKEATCSRFIGKSAEDYACITN